MPTLKTIIAAAIAATTLTNAAPALAGDAICGTYVFAGAYQVKSNAHRQANHVGGTVLDLDRSNSPNAGKGYWVVAQGPLKPYAARQVRNQWQNWGVHDAYTAKRCFYVSYNY